MFTNKYEVMREEKYRNKLPRDYELIIMCPTKSVHRLIESLTSLEILSFYHCFFFNLKTRAERSPLKSSLSKKMVIE